MLFDISPEQAAEGDTAVVLFAHGARDPQWAEPFQRVQRLLRERLTGVPIELAYLEIMQPGLSDTIDVLVDQGRTNITVAPLFMAQGGHLKKDLPLLLDGIRAAHTEVTIRVLPAIGEAEEILALITDWIAREIA